MCSVAIRWSASSHTSTLAQRACLRSRLRANSPCSRRQRTFSPPTLLQAGRRWRRTPSPIPAPLGSAGPARIASGTYPKGCGQATAHWPMRAYSEFIASPRLLLCWRRLLKEPVPAMLASQSPHQEVVSVLPPDDAVCRPGVALPPFLLLGARLRSLGCSQRVCPLCPPFIPGTCYT